MENCQSCEISKRNYVAIHNYRQYRNTTANFAQQYPLQGKNGEPGMPLRNRNFGAFVGETKNTLETSGCFEGQPTATPKKRYNLD